MMNHDNLNRFFSLLVAVTCFSLAVPVNAADTDGDGSTDDEELLSGTAVNNNAERPFWTRTHTGSLIGDLFGTAVFPLDDVNNDGFTDYGVTSRYATKNGCTDCGRVDIYSGNGGALLHSVWGSNGASFGTSADNAGDVNNDGVNDYIVGAATMDLTGDRLGKVFVYSGANNQLLYEFEGNYPVGLLGKSVSGAGDVNNDGYDDLIMGAPFVDTPMKDSGLVRVYSGVDGTLLYEKQGGQDSQFGYSVSGLGDIDDDGYDDFIVGAERAWVDTMDEAGQAYVYSGFDGSLIYSYQGLEREEHLGSAVSEAGDVNNDGIEDFIIGARWADVDGFVQAGYAKVYSGADGSELYFLKGKNTQAKFGTSVNSAGDYNGDGFDDFMVGAIDAENPSGAGTTGAVYLFSGKDGSELLVLYGVDASDDFGTSLAASDLDNDGLTDLLVGAEWSDLVNSNVGYARVYLQADLNNDRDRDFIPDTLDGWVDVDKDQVDDRSDNCPDTSNYLQHDNDNDGIGNACDVDVDGDGVDDVSDSHPLNPLYYTDFDRDRINAENDNCPNVSNYLQHDNDNDGIGNACDTDVDGDGVDDVSDSHPLNPLYYSDPDRDLINAENDNCPTISNYVQSDSDGDGIGNACDPDVDGDGVNDDVDNYPLNPNIW